MKINHTIQSHPFTNRTTNQAKQTAAYQQSSAPSSAAVDLSTAARQLNQLQSDQNDVNMERVNALRQAIADGTLHMDTSRIADHIIASARDLLG